MMQPRLSLLLFAFSAVAASSLSAADKLPAEHAKFFENEVRPLLAEHCYSCHGEDEQEAGLRLDSFADLMHGGESGAAIVSGDPDESILIAAINYESLEMPPDEKLSDDKIAILTRWVAIGAPWPGSDPDAPVRKRELFDEQDRAWWAIQPITLPAVPELSSSLANWPRNEIDHFIASSMVKQKLTPAPEADQLALLRRVYLNVIGLPPTPKQLSDFLADETPDAYEKLVDQLLASRGYAEHTARQWLDLVRYADSNGYRADEYRPDAWRYRDYVIESLHNDKPYDRFVQEQIAGDEMFPGDLDAQVALGYLRHWVYEWNIRDAPTQWNTIVEDLTDTTADVFLGLGLQCAKCHNHKFDPLLQKDYFRLRAFFEPIMPRELVLAEPSEIAEYEAKLHIWEQKSAEIRDEIAAIENPYREKYRDIAIDRFPDDVKQIARKPTEDRTPGESQLAYLVQRQVEDEYVRLDSYIKGDEKEKLVQLRRELMDFESLKPKPLPHAMTVTDVGVTAPPTAIPKRKDDVIEPGKISILDEAPMVIAPTTSTTGRRTALAKWITDPANPLSSRVIANRIWQSHFGRGLAENTSDFGILGGAPSHPELLDWLAKRLVEEGWSLKSLHRTILLSATYRQSTEHPEFAEYHSIDPANDFYWRRDTTRMSAEQIRDSLLLATGRLKDRSGGSGVMSDAPYRSIYTRVMRNSPDELLNSFDLPQFFSSNSSRNTTTTPIQSLLMFNSDLMFAHARHLAEAVSAESGDRAMQIDSAWQRVYGRQATDEELEASIAFIQNQADRLRENEKAIESTAAIETSKLPYRDGQAVLFKINDPNLRLSIPHDSSLNVSDFTIESFFQLRSIASNGDVRTMVGKWDRDKSPVGWRFGVTGKGSRRKPQTLVMQIYGRLADGKIGEAAIFSDQHVEMNKPYYASASVTLAKDGKPGTVTFYLKDLSNDDEPLLTATIEHSVVGEFDNVLPLTIGRTDGENSQDFDGLVDDVRFIDHAVAVDEILYTVERDVTGTIGYWQFEVDPGVMRNTVGPEHNIVARGDSIINLSPDEAALADFCHALLNSNEFLYLH